jgi:hypothetical protein
MIKDYLIISMDGSRFDIDESAPTYLSVFRMRFRPIKKSSVSLKTPCPLQRTCVISKQVILINVHWSLTSTTLPDNSKTGIEKFSKNPPRPLLYI